MRWYVDYYEKTQGGFDTAGFGGFILCRTDEEKALFIAENKNSLTMKITEIPEKVYQERHGRDTGGFELQKAFINGLRAT